MNKKPILAILFLMLFTFSCTVHSEMQNAIAQYERNYVSTEVTYSEPTAQYAFRLNMDSTQTESAKYFFDSNIDDEDQWQVAVKVENGKMV